MGDNINGPSLIRVPDWVTDRLGLYYLYFSHHDGRYIRMAYADDLSGPWQTYEPGVLSLRDSHYSGHIASPDVHIDSDSGQIRMYFHGSEMPSGKGGEQTTRVAISNDGLNFRAQPETLGNPYFRVFRWSGRTFALSMPGVFYRSFDGLTGFERGPALFSKNMRHSAVTVDGDTLRVFYSNVGDVPERILMSTIDLSSDWMNWRETKPIVVIEPETEWEGAGVKMEGSVRGMVAEKACQLRDPAIFIENSVTYLLYSVAGERGIGIAKLID